MSGMAGRKTVKVSVEVRSGAACFRVGVQTRGIRNALDLVAKRYPTGEVKLVLPIESEGSFVRERTASEAMVGSGQTHEEAA